jgi:hypothetical protein
MDTKKCTNCTRGPQQLSEFENEDGRVFKTCRRCREKGKKNDQKPERKEYHTQLQKERGDMYRLKSAEKKMAGIVDTHNLDQTCQWNESEKNKERISLWKKLNVHERIGTYIRNAFIKGLDWKLTNEQASEMMTQKCTYCGYLDLDVRLNGIDRLYSDQGYIFENCVPCCKDCNYMKRLYDPQTFIEKCKVIAQCKYEFPDANFFSA